MCECLDGNMSLCEIVDKEVGECIRNEWRSVCAAAQ